MKITQKSKKIIALTTLVLIIAAIIIAVGMRAHKKNLAAKAAAEAQKQKKEYSKYLNTTAYAILLSASDAETCGNLTKQVWYNAIYKESDIKTDKYTRPDGYYVSDFNDALHNLFSDSSFSSKVTDVNNSKDSINSLMKKLKNPPEEYKDAYESISKLYDAYISLTNLATEPTGSLQSYSQNFTDADNETINCYNALKIYLDE